MSQAPISVNPSTSSSSKSGCTQLADYPSMFLFWCIKLPLQGSHSFYIRTGCYRQWWPRGLLGRLFFCGSKTAPTCCALREWGTYCRRGGCALISSVAWVQGTAGVEAVHSLGSFGHKGRHTRSVFGHNTPARMKYHSPLIRTSKEVLRQTVTF